MRWLVRLAIENPVMLNLVFGIVVVAGVIAWVTMPKEEFPEVVTDRVVVRVIYPGASPDDVEDEIIRPVEDIIDGVDRVKHVYADALESRANITIEFSRGTDVETAREDVERAVNTLELPDEAAEPYVGIARLDLPVVWVGLTGDVRQLDLAEDIADDLSDFSGVAEVDIRGAAERVVSVDLDPAAAASRQISPTQVAGLIQAAATGAPAGRIDGSERVLVRTERGAADVATIRAIPVGDLTLGDIARVEETWEHPEVRHYVNGQPAIAMIVRGQDDADNLALVPDIEDWVDTRARTLPPGLDLVAYDDSARIVKDRIDVLVSNGLIGVLLVMIALVIFTGMRNALLVMWGMPVAFLGGIVLMDVWGLTINVISTFAMIIVTGIIVDDAVIIVENVQRHLEQGKSRVDACIDGTSEVFGAVTASTLTTCLAFAPLLMLEGVMGQIMSIVPSVVIFALVASLFEAFFILPGHLGHWAKEQPEKAENLPTRMLKSAYGPFVRSVTGPVAKYGALVALVIGFVAVMSLTLLMRTSLTTAGQPVFVLVNVDLPASASPDQTRQSLERVEELVLAEAADMTLWMSGRTGQQVSDRDMPMSGARFGQLKLGFHNDPAVLDRVPAFMDRIREHLRGDPAVQAFALETLEGGPPSGRPIDFRVRSARPEQVMPMAQALEAHLLAREAVEDVRNDAGRGADELRVVVDPDKAALLGLQEGQVAQAARAALDGQVAVELPIAGRTTEVRVGLEGFDDIDVERLADLPLVTPQGVPIRLRQVADVQRLPSVERIQRVDGQRAVRVSALIDDARTTSDAEQDALEDAFAGLQGTYPDTTLFYGGEIADAAESFGQLPSAFLLAVGMIYVVLGIQFRSYLQPLIILAAVPLGLTGVVLGLFVLGMDLSFIAMVGTVGLVGIVVNDSLVLIDFVNKARDRGLEAREAVIEGALTRLRPILITTVTTVLGLLPLALGIAGAEPLLAPMAVSISFGLAFATGLTLVAVPVLYLVIEDLRSIPRRLMRAEPTPSK